MDSISFGSADEFLECDPFPKGTCIISDIRMPGTSGLEIPTRLTERGIHIPIIFLTAYDSPETRAQARACGASAYFHKPVDESALLDAVAWALCHTTAT